MNHTPTPWYRADNLFAKKATILSRQPEMGTHVLTMNTNGLNWEANAEFIIRCCNSHADLVAALEMQISAFSGDAIDEIEMGYGLGTAQRVDAARAALAKAKGE